MGIYRNMGCGASSGEQTAVPGAVPEADNGITHSKEAEEMTTQECKLHRIKGIGDQPVFADSWLTAHSFLGDRDVRDQFSCWMHVNKDMNCGAKFKKYFIPKVSAVFNNNAFLLELTDGGNHTFKGFVSCHKFLPGDTRDDQSCWAECFAGDLDGNMDRAAVFMAEDCEGGFRLKVIGCFGDQPVFHGYLSCHYWHDSDKRDAQSCYCMVHPNPDCAAIWDSVPL